MWSTDLAGVRQGQQTRSTTPESGSPRWLIIIAIIHAISAPRWTRS